MPKPLYALTDSYYEEPVPQPLPVEQPFINIPNDIPRVVISNNVGTDNIVRPVPDYVNPPAGNAVAKLVAKLTGAEGERYQLWPEKIIREGLTAAGEIMQKGAISPGLRREDYTDIPAPDMPTKDSTWLGKKLNVAPVAWSPQDKIIEDAQAMSALAGSGGIAGTGAEAGMALGATPFLRPALRYKDKLYKGKEGQQHLDVIPEQLYPDFQKKAMSGEDINDYNFGFINDKGQFLSREKALEYGINTGLIDPQAGKFGALTSTLMADSSKPGTAIEAVGKTAPDLAIKNLIASAKNRNVELLARYDKYSNDYILDWIESKGIAAAPREGTKVIKELMDQADITKSKIQLIAIADNEVGGDYLPKYYEALGFKRTGEETPDGVVMVRKPNAKMNKELAAKILNADSSKEGAAIQANKPTFYSAVEHNVNAIPQAKMTGDQWLGTLANKPGVKGEELDWTGLKGFLEDNKGKPVTKQQIEEHLAANKVELKEVGKGEEFNIARKAKAQELMAKLSELEKDNIAKGTFRNTPEMEKIQNELQAVREQSQAVTTKYQSYQLPGAENYREMLLTLPAKKSQEVILKEAQLRAKEGHYPNTEWKDIPEPMRKDYLATAERTQDKNYKSSHWDEPNILAHVRMNDRTIDGKKSLHVEEIQSDWHQTGRDKGYKGDNTNISLDRAKAITAKIGGTNDPLEVHPTARLRAFNDGKITQSEWDDLNKYINENTGNSFKVPDAPFKKTWHELALKRMIREAAEKGYDRLSWTPGEAQAARYDLSKQVDTIQATKLPDGTYNVHARPLNDAGFSSIGERVPENKLADIVGKDLAEKISKQNVDKASSYKGVDLKIGGEGMKGFYDKMIPAALEKLGKEHGVKVKSYGVSPEEAAKKLKDFETSLKSKPMTADQKTEWNKLRDDVANSKNGKLFYIDIPDSLKNQALQKGFPLFSAGGYLLLPVVGNPFESQK